MEAVLERNPFADIESDLDGKGSFVPTTEAADFVDHSLQHAERTLKNTSQQRVAVQCNRCHGSGTFYGYSGRALGACFACKGAGKILRAPGYVEAKARREKAKAERAAADRAALAAALIAFKEAYPDVVTAINDYNSDRTRRYASEFMESITTQLTTRGSLSEGQIAAIRRGIEKRAAATAERIANAEHFPNIVRFVREQNLSLHLGECKVTLFRSGAVAIVAPVFGEGVFGIIDGNGLRRHKGLTDGMLATLRDVEARGIEAVKEIGKATGRCCVCSRTLTDPESIEAGIGPICGQRFGSFNCKEVGV